jgi:hypothetical protein
MLQCKKRKLALLSALLATLSMLAVFALTYTCYTRDSCGERTAPLRRPVVADAAACPAAVNYSHPSFVCPPQVLARRRPLGGNQSAEYYRLGGAALFMSQFWEDWFLYTEFFHEARYRSAQDGGSGDDYTFVELGGYDGRSGSNSYFYDKYLGWRGLLLEASTANYALLEKARLAERVATIHGAVCTADRLLSLWGGHSLTANNRLEANGLFHGSEESLCVCLAMPRYIEMAERWPGFLSNNHSRLARIDYFSIDVEGQELEVIESHDWVRWPVFVVSLEVAVQPLLSGTHEYQHLKRCALFRRGLCRWPFYDDYVPPTGDDGSEGAGHFSRNNEIWVNPALLGKK